MQDRIEHSSPNVTAEQAKSILEVIGAPSDRLHIEVAQIVLGIGRRALAGTRTRMPPTAAEPRDFPARLTRAQVAHCLEILDEPADKFAVDLLGGMISRLGDSVAA